MGAEAIIQDPGVVPYRWTADGYIAAINEGLVKHSRLEMIEGVVIIDVWAPHGRVPEGPGVDPYRWDSDEFLAILDAGLIEEPHEVELLDGIMARKEPPGDDRDAARKALRLALPTSDALLSSPRLVLGRHSVGEPEFAALRPKAAGREGPTPERDVLWAIDVAAFSFDKDPSPRMDAYARAGVPHYWVVDAKRRGVWTFSRPEGGLYREERFVAVGESLTVPVVGKPLEVSAIFPPSDAGTRRV